MKEEEAPCRKKAYQKVGFELRLSIIDEIQNGRISVNYASKKHNISRSSITYWMQKYSTLEQRKQGMSKQYEIKRLKERVEELEFIKELQQDIIIDLESITGQDIAKKSLPGTLAKELSKRKRNRSK
jgi:transposase-like protein